MEAHIHLCFMSSILILSLGYIQGKVNCLNLLYWGYPINFMYYIISGKVTISPLGIASMCSRDRLEVTCIM